MGHEGLVPLLDAMLLARRYRRSRAESYSYTANTRKATKNLARAANGQPNLHTLEYTCEPVSSFQGSPHPVVPLPKTTVAVTLVVLGLSFPNDNEIVHAGVYLSYNRPGVPSASEFENRIQIWV